jgi:hypothetical protein
MSNNTIISLGCSHSAGSEIDGKGDSNYNRKNSFGGVLARDYFKGDWDHQNFSICGGSNNRIFELTCAVLADIINKDGVLTPGDDRNFFFLIGWTSLNRVDLRYPGPERWTQCGDAFKLDQHMFPGAIGCNPKMIQNSDIRRAFEMAPWYADDALKQTQLASQIMAVQSMLRAYNIDFYMFNAIENYMRWSAEPPVNWNTDSVESMYKLIDTNTYYYPTDPHQNYYRWCTEQKGHTNMSNKYWHLGQEAHNDWAGHIFPEIKKTYEHVG